MESDDAVRLPLKLAVALLKDRNGVIDIDLPMTGSLDDPQFRMGPLIWKAFVGLLTKAATAPFALLGSLFGGGEEMNLIEFDAGTSALDAAAQERLASIIQGAHRATGTATRGADDLLAGSRSRGDRAAKARRVVALAAEVE